MNPGDHGVIQSNMSYRKDEIINDSVKVGTLLFFVTRRLRQSNRHDGVHYKYSKTNSLVTLSKDYFANVFATPLWIK